MNKRIIFRLPDKMYEQIREAITQGKFRSVSQLVRAAVEQLLKEV